MKDKVWEIPDLKTFLMVYYADFVCFIWNLWEYENKNCKSLLVDVRLGGVKFVYTGY